MLVIHSIHRLEKLFTLKHSCFLVNFTLKRSCFYAETLLRYIYTYICLYKNTCSWHQQIVNNFFVKKISYQIVFIKRPLKLTTLFLCIIISQLSLSACYAPRQQRDQIHPPVKVNQGLATKVNPAQFYVCGGENYLCKSPTAIWQAKRPYEKSNRFISKKKGAKQCIKK